MNAQIARQRMLESFTSNDVINSWGFNETNIEFRGYVDEISGLRTITTNPTSGIQTQLLTLFANNGKGSRVRIVIWAQAAVNVHAQVNVRSIITISQVHCKQPWGNWLPATEIKELKIGRNTVVTIGPGTYN